MEHVLTLIAPDGQLADATVARVAQVLKDAGHGAGSPDWLASATACDLPLATPVPPETIAELRQELASHPVDIAVLPAGNRRKRLLIADMESTIIENEMLDELAAEVGLEAEIAGITAKAMAGELDFEGAIRARVGMLRELDAAALERVLGLIRFTPGAGTLVATMRADGAYCALVSGGFGCFTGWVRDRLGFDYDQANELEIRDGRLTGRLSGAILGREAKRAALASLTRQRGIAEVDSIAVGDGANDLDMLEAAGLGVAFRAKPIVAQRARIRIDHGDLTALLYMQGYRRAEFRS